MRNKKKAFTVLELIIAISITVIVLGVVYTFFLSNSKTLATTEINSDLQMESEQIYMELLKYGTQAEGISRINDIGITSSNKYNYEGLPEDGKINVSELTFKIGMEYFTFIYNSANKTLTLNKVNEYGDVISDASLRLPRDLSKNVTEFKVRPLDYRMNPKGNFYDSTGLEISLVLNKKKGYSDVTIPVSIIVKLRNK
ncbi:MAG: prepilin-type N-terminal cleavage/methylation domain-containing protein [Clostridium sp.]|uniref:type II secretion system protein n=1 Tax=Clostridium sp. TaxID=1506 RepID=UPI0025C5FEAB|nr:prepilin-type N-terminal cleavage/methylation domain-containing protein [Clostridium sp.]MCF0146803.1 prepilin-type N-terminal cleavage/methylation domain-containing protein [Clostridium sp.]